MDGRRLVVETEIEEDGRWIAEVAAMPGVLAYGDARDKAIVKARALALSELADRLQQGELFAEPGPC
jgi:predicted RNase H-like HicB family nuclease